MIFKCITKVLVSPNIIVFNDMLFSGSLQPSPLNKSGDISNPKYYQTIAYEADAWDEYISRPAGPT